MKFKMSDKSVFALLLRSPWWISMALVVAIAAAAKVLLPESYVAVGVTGGFPFLVIGIIAAWKQIKAPNPERMNQTLQAAGVMNWRDFSSALERGYQGQGFVVTRLPSGPADLRLEKSGRTTLVSGKRWKAGSHGVQALRELAALREAQDASFCSYVSLGALTSQAEKFAKDNAVALVNGTALAQLISPG